MLALALLAVSRPALAQNQFPDPVLTEPADYSAFGHPAARYELPAIRFTNAAISNVIVVGGPTGAALLAAWGPGETRLLSVNAYEFSGGDVQCRFRGGTWVSLGLDGTRPSVPINITAGISSQGLLCRGTGYTNVTIRFGDGVDAIIIASPSE